MVRADRKFSRSKMRSSGYTRNRTTDPAEIHKKRGSRQGGIACLDAADSGIPEGLQRDSG